MVELQRGGGAWRGTGGTPHYDPHTHTKGKGGFCFDKGRFCVADISSRLL